MGMDINWGLGGGGNNALALFGQGAQMGQQVAARREQREYQNALLQQRQQELDHRLKAEQETAAEKARKQHDEQMGTFRNLLEHAKDNPQQAFSAAQSMGLDLTGVPQPGTPEFEPWRQTQLFIVEAAQKDPEILTNAAKEVMLTLPPEHRSPNDPVFIQAFGQHMQAEATKIISTQPGGGVAQYNPTTGQTQFVIQPNDGSHPVGAPAGGAVPPPPPGFQIDGGGQTATPSATFSGSFRGLSGERVTSTLRSPAHNRAVGGVSNSYHLTGQARDSVPPPGMSLHAYYQQLKALNPDKDVILESDHVHMEPRG